MEGIVKDSNSFLNLLMLMELQMFTWKMGYYGLSRDAKESCKNTRSISVY